MQNASRRANKVYVLLYELSQESHHRYLGFPVCTQIKKWYDK